MSDFTISEEGIVQFRVGMVSAIDIARPEVQRVLGAYAQKIRSDAINSMRRSAPTGQRYTLRIKGRKKAIEHRASAPGQPPAVITGRLWNSYTVDARNWSFEIGPTVNYGKYLELGTKKMDPRPALIPALEANRQGLENALAGAIRTALRGVT